MAKAQVTQLFDEIGFDTVDLGPLAESWRIQPGTPGYGPRLDAEDDDLPRWPACVRPVPTESA